MTNSTRLSVGLALLAGLSACAEPSALPLPADSVDPAALRIEVLASSPAPGEVVNLRFVNTSEVPYGVNVCSRRVEKSIDGAWVEQPAELRLCTADLQAVGANASTTHQTDVPLDLRAGLHRFVLVMHATDIEGGDVTITAYSTVFEVR